MTTYATKHNTFQYLLHVFLRPAESVQSDGPADKISNNRTTPSVKSQPAPNCPIHRQLAVITNPKHAKLLSKLNLCREVDRLLTFTDLWPRRSAPLEQDMAASGWFFLGNLDRTQCFSCGGVLRNWRRLDNPHTEHTTHFPHCSMAQGRENRNIPNKNFQVISNPELLICAMCVFGVCCT